jgi:autotransporter-associated beta strand protein
MKHQKIAVITLAILLAMLANTSQGQTTVFKANNNTDPSTAASWVGGVAPTSVDFAAWDSTVATAASCTNNMANSVTWGGIVVSNPAAPVSITASATSKIITVNSSGINLSNSTVDVALNCGITVPASNPQTWAVTNGHILAVGLTGANIAINSDLALYGYFRVSGTEFRPNGGSTLMIPAGTTVEFPAASDTLFDVAQSGDGTVNQTGGLVKLGRITASKGSLALGSGGVAIYNLNGGQVIDTNSPSSGFIVVGNTTAGTLNVNGGSLLVKAIQLANGSGGGTINVTNGTVTTTGGTFILTKATVGGTSALNVFGGTVDVRVASMTVGSGASAVGPASVYLTNGTINVGSSLTVPGGSPQPATVTVDGGFLNVTNSVSLLSSGSGNGTFNLNGGTLTTASVTKGTGTGTAAFNINGGILKARAISTAFIAAGVPVSVGAKGVVIDNGGFGITVPAVLASGASPDGGLTSLGSGTLTLTTNNTYNGLTTVGGGTLVVGTTNVAGGTILPGNARIAVTNGTLDAVLAMNGTTLVCSNLSFGGSGGSGAARFDCGTNSNPTVPIIYATNLTANGTVNVSVYGSGLTVGAVPLIQYEGSVSGGGTFALTYMQGGSGYITNDATAQQVQLVITGVAFLEWRAQVNTNWDTSTANWWDLTNSVFTTFANGASVTFDDTASNSLVIVNGSVLPSAMTINNSASNYVFSGTGGIGGSGGLLKLGTGMVTMGMSNYYTGSTAISNGVFRLATNNAIPGGVGYGDVTLEGTLDLAGFNDTFNALNGVNGIVDNSSSTPAVLTVGRHVGVFSGHITNSGSGNLSLNVASGSLALLSTNSYRGGTTNAGSLQLASEQSISPGPLALNGGSLYWTDAAAHTLTNIVTIGGNLSFGQITNGPLTITDPVDFGGTGDTLTCNTDVEFSKGMTNGSLASKYGPGKLTLKHTVAQWSGSSFSLNNGALILDNCTVTQLNNNFRIQGGANILARMVITNGSSFILTGSASGNFVFGESSVGVDSTNVLDLSGTLYLMPQSAGNDKFVMGKSTDPIGMNTVNLLSGGVLEVRQVTDSSPNSTSTFNFNGGTLMPSTNDSAATFMTGLNYAYVLDGGAIIDTAGYNITIGQDLLNGGTGGLTKQGLGTLYLTGTGYYTNTTLVSVGALSGAGTLNGPVAVASGASLLVGSSNTIGTLTINSTLTFNSGGTNVMKITRTGGLASGDNIANATAVHYGGTLVVKTNVNMTEAFAAGDSIQLFPAPASYTGSFASTNLPALAPGMAWDTSYLTTDGTLRIKSVPLTPPLFNSTVLSGTNLVMSGTGGAAGGTYYVYATTNLALPLSGWTPVATNTFDGSGNFSFTNAVESANPEQFFDIVVP